MTGALQNCKLAPFSVVCAGFCYSGTESRAANAVAISQSLQTAAGVRRTAAGNRQTAIGADSRTPNAEYA